MINIKNIILIVTILTSTTLFSTDYDNTFWKYISEGKYSLAAERASIIGKENPQYHLLSTMAYLPSNNTEKMDEQYYLFMEKANEYPPSLIEKEFKIILDDYNKNSNILAYIGIFTWTYRNLFSINGEELLYKSLSINSNDFLSNNYVSMLEYNNNNWNKALEHALKSINNSKNYSEPYVNASNAYLKLNKEKEAIDILIKCFKECSDPHDNAYFNLFNFLGESGSGIVQDFNKTLMAPTLRFEDENLNIIYKSTNHSEKIYFKLINHLIDKASYGAANFFIEKSNDILQKTNSILFLKIKLYYKSYSEKNFKKYLLEYQNKTHNDKTYIVEIARMALQFKSFNIAIELYEELLQFNDVKEGSYEIMTYYSSLGLLNAENGDLKKANYYWDLALEIDPKDDITLKNKNNYNSK